MPQSTLVVKPEMTPITRQHLHPHRAKYVNAIRLTNNSGTSALTLKKHCLLPFLLHCVVQDTPPHLPSTHKLLSNATFTVADKVHISALYRYHEWRLPAERLKTTADFRFRLTMLYYTHLRIDISMTDQHLVRSSPLLTTLKFTPTACNALNALEHTDCEIP